MALIKLCLRPKILNCSLSWIFPVFSYVVKQVSEVTLREKDWIISVTEKSEISNVCNTVECHCPQAIKIMHHHADGRFIG